jgi:protease-4
MDLERLDSIKEVLARLSRSYIFLVIAALVLGYLIFNAFVAQPKVGIIKISGAIMDKSTVDDIVSMLRYAEDTDEIKAVVLEINSPGGEVTACEELYMGVLGLRKEKPVVASINQIGASGAYYVAIASNFIYVKPSSSIGSIGVLSRLPRPEILDEEIITTGPFKRTGSPRKDYAYEIQMVEETFLNAVMLQRGDKLKISKEELSKAEVYSGIEGLRLGLVDAIGSNSDAIEKAAEYAGIANYELIDINKELNITQSSTVMFVNESALKAPTNTQPINYYLYVELEK